MSSSEKRSTVFPTKSTTATNINQFGKRAADAEIQRPLRLSAPELKAPQAPGLHQSKRTPPAPLPVKVNPNSNHFSPGNRFKRQSAVATVFRCHKGNPWQAYRAVLKEHAGHVTLAHTQTPAHTIVAIKQQKCLDSTDVTRLASCSHKNVVYLLEAFVEEDVVSFVYEVMDVSLAQVQSTPSGSFASYQIAAVCKEVLEGLQYIHHNLRILYGSVNAENVMINRDGSIKLTNIGQSMLDGVSNSQQDFRALGLLMVRLMEHRTSLRDPNTLQLQEPRNWNDDIKSFLTGTAQSSGETLQKHTFLESSPGSSCLKPLVLITERSGDWEMCT